MNSNPATIMTDKDIADRCLHRAADRRSSGAADQKREAGQRASYTGRTGRLEPCHGAGGSWIS